MLILATDDSEFLGAALDAETRLCATPDGLRFHFHPRIDTNAVSLVVCRPTLSNGQVVYGTIGMLLLGWDDEIDWDVQGFSIADVDAEINETGYDVTMRFDLTEAVCEGV